MTGWGCLVTGSKGAIFTSCPWNTRLELLPKEKTEELQRPRGPCRARPAITPSGSAPARAAPSRSPASRSAGR